MQKRETQVKVTGVCEHTHVEHVVKRHASEKEALNAPKQAPEQHSLIPLFGVMGSSLVTFSKK